MKFLSTILPDVFVIEPERLGDARGFFARTWCQQEAAAQGLHPTWVQCNISFNRTRGALRGMHYQTTPAARVS